MSTTSPAAALTALLTETGTTPTAAAHIAAHTLRNYTDHGTATPDPLTDLTDELRGLTFECASALLDAGRLHYGAVCPDMGPALDHAAAAVRTALHHTR